MLGLYKISYLVYKVSIFVGFGRGDWLAVLTPNFLEKLIFGLKLVSCCFWWKALVIAPRPDL